MRAATSVDLNQDGWADLCVATNNGPIYAFERQPPKADGQGTSLRILGSRRNPGSLGAIVDVVGATKQRLEVSSNSGYLSQSSPQICLGALPNGSPDETVATVRWSDGKQEKVRLESGKLNTITHPEHRPSNGDGLSLARSQAKHREWLALNLELAQDFQLNGDIESAMRTIRRVIGGAPENPAGYLIYANLLRQQKRYREARDVVAKLYQAGGQGSPEVLMTGGRILHELERYDEAMAQYQLAVKIAPERQDLKLVVADTLVAQGRLRSAIAMLSSVKDPTAPVKQKLAKVRGRIDSIREKLRASRELMKTDTPAAMKSYAQVLALDGDSLESLNNLAWHHATHPDSAQRNGWRAVRYAERAKRITGGKNASVLDTLSAAYAEAGDFGKAIETVKEVLASSKTSEKQKASSQTKLEAYLKRQPIRTEQ
jgi:tetratricopeptide (TPR) repeat protein